MLAGTGFQVVGTQYVHETRLMSICVALLRMDDIWASLGCSDFNLSHDWRRSTICEAADERKTRGDGGLSNCNSGQILGVGTMGVSRPREVFI